MVEDTPHRTPEACIMSGNAASSSTHVYILGFSDGVVKIGRTGNPDRRFSALKLEAEKRGASLIGSWLRATTTPARSEDALRAIGRMSYEFEQGREYFRASFNEFLAKVETLAFIWRREVTDHSFDVPRSRIRCSQGLSIADFAYMCSIPERVVLAEIVAGRLYPDVPNGFSMAQAEAWVKALPYAKPERRAS